MYEQFKCCMAPLCYEFHFKATNCPSATCKCVLDICMTSGRNSLRGYVYPGKEETH